MEAQDERNISLIDLLQFLKKKAWILVLALMTCALAGFLGTELLMNRQYTASTRVYVMNHSGEAASYSDYQTAALIRDDYRVLITGRNVTGEVLRQLGLDWDCEDLAKKIRVTFPEDTRFVQISVTDTDPQRAAALANGVREAAAVQIQALMDVDGVSLVYEAAVPERSSGPNTGWNTALAALTGLIVTAAILTLVFAMDDTLRTEEDAERYLGLEVMGVIPDSPELRDAKCTGAVYGAEKIPVSGLAAEDFPTAEAIKVLRANILFSGGAVKAVALTSCGVGEGKSTVALQLAVSMARTGRRVLLLDADLRESVLARRLRFRGSGTGLSHYLSGRAGSEKLVWETDVPGLYVLFAGDRVPDAAEMLSGKRFGNLIAGLKGAFDYIFVDTPPLGQVIDCALMAPALDGTVLVIDAAHNSGKQEHHIKAQLEKSGGRILGVVLNRGAQSRKTRRYERKKRVF